MDFYRNIALSNYRKDIDGLRAISVLLVIFYHLRSSVFKSGFIGVDVFFVISGFLITTHILKEIEEKKFSIINFYLKRLRRIVPALIFVLFFVSVAAFFLLLPNSLRHYTSTVLASTVFLSNLYFWMYIDLGYFSTNIETIPLLHTWSLGVEEQYYLIWPIIIVTIVSFIPKNRIHYALSFAALTILCISFTICLLIPVFADIFPIHTPFFDKGLYYSPITRAFEPMVGSILAMYYEKIKLPKNKLINNLLSLFSLGLILYFGIFLKENNYPGITTFFLCLGVVFLLLVGKEKYPFATQILSNPVLVFFGLISYSLYLWHWPIIVFLNYFNIPLTPVIQAEVILLTIALSWLTWRWIETPFRFKFKMNLAKSSFLFLIIPILLALSLFILVRIYPAIGFNKISLAALKNTNKYYGVLKRNFGCINNKSEYKLLPSKKLCEIGDLRRKNSTAILVGDSHAMADVGMLNFILKNAHLKAYVATQGGTPFILGNISNWRANKPMDRNVLLAKKIQHERYEYVIFAGFWNYYPNLPEKNVNLNARPYEAFIKAFSQAIRFVIEEGSTPVIILDTPPLLTISKECGFTKINLGNCYNSIKRVDREQRITRALLLNLKKQYPKIIFLDPEKVICRHSKCYSSIKGIPLYMSDRTNSHLSFFGSALIGRLYLKWFGNPFK